MEIKDDKQAKIARNIGIVWTIFAYIGALSLGWIGIALFGPAGLNDPEYVMPSVILKLKDVTCIYLTSPLVWCIFIFNDFY